MKEIIRKFLLEQEDDYIKITSSDYLSLLDKYDVPIFVYKHLTRSPENKNKKILIIGSLDVSDKPINNLPGIAVVDGRLDISRTNISDISGIKYKYLSDWNTPHEKIRLKKELQRKLAEAQEKRDENLWSLDNPDIDEEGLLANAAFEYIKYRESENYFKSEDDVSRLDELNKRMEENLQKEKEYEEQGRDTTDIIADIQVTEDEISELNNKIDIYNLSPFGKHYYLTEFEIINSEQFDGWKIAVGTEEEADSSLDDYFEELLNNPTEYFQISYLENFIDEEEVLDVFREHYEYDVQENPEVYFNDDDFQLTDEQEAEKERLENEKSEYEERLEEYEEGSEEYERIQEHIDDLDSQISDIEPDNEPTQQMIDDKVDDMLYDVKRNIISHMEDLGLDITRYLDKDDLLNTLKSDESFGVLNGGDGSYDEINILGETYVVMIIDK